VRILQTSGEFFQKQSLVCVNVPKTISGRVVFFIGSTMDEISFNPAHVAQPSCTLNTDDFDDDDISINPSYLENLNQNAINIINPTTRIRKKEKSNYDLFNEIVSRRTHEKSTLSLQQKLKRKEKRRKKRINKLRSKEGLVAGASKHNERLANRMRIKAALRGATSSPISSITDTKTSFTTTTATTSTTTATTIATATNIGNTEPIDLEQEITRLRKKCLSLTKGSKMKDKIITRLRQELNTLRSLETAALVISG
jgi:hypothetical protein